MNHKVFQGSLKWLLAAAILFPAPARAELVYGEVISSNPRNDSVYIWRIDPATGRTSQMEVFIPKHAEFSGVKSLWDLEAGDQILVDGQTDGQRDQFEAGSVEAVKNPKNI